MSSLRRTRCAGSHSPPPRRTRRHRARRRRLRRPVAPARAAAARRRADALRLGRHRGAARGRRLVRRVDGPARPRRERLGRRRRLLRRRVRRRRARRRAAARREAGAGGRVARRHRVAARRGRRRRLPVCRARARRHRAEDRRLRRAAHHRVHAGQRRRLRVARRSGRRGRRLSARTASARAISRVSRRTCARCPDGRLRWHWDPRFLQPGHGPQPGQQPERLRAAARKLRVPTLLVRGKLSDLLSEEGAQRLPRPGPARALRRRLGRRPHGRRRPQRPLQRRGDRVPARSASTA